MKKLYKIGLSFTVFFLSFFWACESPFSFSPFEANIPEEIRNTTEKNLLKIAKLDSAASPSFKVALLSDAHYHFNNLKDALADINKQEDIAFIIVTGDITENGLQKEFELFHHIMSESRKPYLTVIGNHDYLSNGGTVYQQIFGPLNYTFTFQKVKFVMWDNVVWESNKTPDWTWFERSLSTLEDGLTSRAEFTHIIPFSHIPPFDGQLSDRSKWLHDLLLSNNIKLSVHGHKHQYSNEQLGGDEIRYVTIGSPQYRGYALLSVTPTEISVQKIEY